MKYNEVIVALFGRFGSAHKTLAHLPYLHHALTITQLSVKLYYGNPTVLAAVSERKANLSFFNLFSHVYRQTATANSVFSNTSLQSITLQSSSLKSSLTNV